MTQRIKIDPDISDQDIKKMFKQYLDICNEAIEQNKHKFPYREALNLSEVILKNKPIDLAVYDDEPKAAVSIELKDEKLVKAGHPADVKKAWRLNLSYIRKVIQDPEKYINHPEKLDLDWLKSRLGF